MAPSRKPGRPAVRRQTAPAALPRRAKAAPPAPKAQDVTRYATQPPTDYHRQYAKWIVNSVGYDLANATSVKAAFLAGVSIATAARNAFMASPELEAWRDREGLAKPGRRPASETQEAPTRRRKAAMTEFLGDDEDDDETEVDDETDDFDDEDESEASDDSDFDDDDDEDSDEFDDDDDEVEADEEPLPAKRRGRPAAKPAAKSAAPRASRTARGTAAKPAVPARGKPASRKANVAVADDDFAF